MIVADLLDGTSSELALSPFLPAAGAGDSPLDMFPSESGDEGRPFGLGSSTSEGCNRSGDGFLIAAFSSAASEAR